MIFVASSVPSATGPTTSDVVVSHPVGRYLVPDPPARTVHAHNT
jgi:hypothetical protein